MRVLMIEDDNLKAERLSQWIAEALPLAVFDRTKSYHSGLRALQERPYDLVLLDMTLPTFDLEGGRREGRPRSMGGRDIMRKMVRRGIKGAVVVVTQFGTFGEGEEQTNFVELGEACGKEFPDLFIGIVQYQASSESWSKKLKNLLSEAGL